MAYNGNPYSLLALEEKPNSFVPIDLKSIGIDFPCDNLTLKDVDNCILLYGAEYIKEAIKKANVVSLEALSGELVILYEENGQKRKTSVLPPRNVLESNQLIDVMLEHISNKNFANRLITKIKVLKISNDVKYNMIECLKLGYAPLFVQAFYLLPYIDQRKLYFYVLKAVLNKSAARIREKDSKEAE